MPLTGRSWAAYLLEVVGSHLLTSDFRTTVRLWVGCGRRCLGPSDHGPIVGGRGSARAAAQRERRLSVSEASARASTMKPATTARSTPTVPYGSVSAVIVFIASTA